MRISKFFTAALCAIAFCSKAQHTTLVHFDGTTTGSNPYYTSLIQASDGMLYGVNAYGGTNNLGTLYQYDISTNTFVNKFSFGGVASGRYPAGSLLQASDGMLYGLTSEGGANNKGVLFQFNPVNSVYTKKIDFDYFTIGANPMGTLIQASDGMLYGVTYDGGANNNGVLFQYDISTDTLIKKYDFSTSTTGGGSYGSLLQATDGMLYGMTSQGGLNSMGVLFQFDPTTSTYTKKIDFGGVTSARMPTGSLIQASDGFLYGAAGNGGLYNEGVIFQYDINTNTYTHKVDFATDTTGQNPKGSLLQANNGIMYGITYAGGVNNKGTIFRYNPNTTECKKLFDFNAPSTGIFSVGTFMQANDGFLYAMSKEGGNGGSCGANGCGTLFKYQDTTTCIASVTDSLVKDTTTPFTWYALPTYSANVINARWYWGDGTDTLALYPSHTYSNAGFYNVCVTAYSSCGDSAIYCTLDSLYKLSSNNAMIQLNVVPGITTGITPPLFPVKPLVTFPNPAKDNVTFTFDVNETSNVTMELYNLQGEKINVILSRSFEKGKNTYTVNLDQYNITSGTYMIKASINNNNSYVKLVVIK